MLRRTAWGAIFAGTMVALASQVLLTTLGLAIGAATVNPATDAGSSTEGLGAFAGIWMLLTALVSLFLGGLVAAWLAGFPRWLDGMIHGVVVWGLSTGLTMWLVVTGTVNFLGGAVSTVQSAMASPAAGEVYRDVTGRGGSDPVIDELRLRGRELLGADESGRSTARPPIDADVGRQREGRIMGAPERERWEQVGQDTADTLTRAAGWSFFAMLLGLGAAAFGGAIGRPHSFVEENRRVIPE